MMRFDMIEYDMIRHDMGGMAQNLWPPKMDGSNTEDDSTYGPFGMPIWAKQWVRRVCRGTGWHMTLIHHVLHHYTQKQLLIFYKSYKPKNHNDIQIILKSFSSSSNDLISHLKSVKVPSNLAFVMMRWLAGAAVATLPFLLRLCPMHVLFAIAADRPQGLAIHDLCGPLCLGRKHETRPLV